MLTERQQIRRLYYYGHAWNPEYPETHHLTLETLPQTFSDPLARIMLKSYQRYQSQAMEQFSMAAHGRPAKLDGESGPATQALLEMPRCGHPDFPQPQAATGSGSWPMPCQKTGVHFSVNKSRMPSTLSGRIDRILARVVEAYADVGLKLVETQLHHPTVIENVMISWRALAGSTIGLAEFNNERCDDTCFHYLDPSYMDQNDDQIARLICHELGHNCNLYHTRGGIMHPSIQKGPFNGWLPDDPSMPALTRFFGGDPLPVPAPPQPPTPGPQPPGDVVQLDIVLRGPLTLAAGETRKLIAVPAPDL